MNRVKNGFFLILGLLLIAWSGYMVLQEPAPAKYQPQKETQILTIGGKTLAVEVVSTNEARAQGLSGRTSLPAGHGMLFVFETAEKHGFWMKDMSFPIDIIWLDEDYRIVDIARSVSPGTFPQAFYPPTPVKYVLETNPGEI